jgi:hypothetical protein
VLGSTDAASGDAAVIRGHAAADRRVPRLVLVSGPAGVGK